MVKSRRASGLQAARRRIRVAAAWPGPGAPKSRIGAWFAQTGFLGLYGRPSTRPGVVHASGVHRRPGRTTVPFRSLEGPPIGTMSDPIWKNSRPGAGRDGTAIDCARTKNTQITHRPHPRAVPRRSGLHPSGLHPSGRRRTGGYWPSRRPTGRRPQGRHQSGRRL